MPTTPPPVSYSPREHPLVDLGDRPRRYTLCLTLRCNLACSYCYVGKNQATMSWATACRAIDFIFGQVPAGSKVEIGFFGGEPLLEFSLLRDLTNLIENHPSYDPSLVSFTLTTNGTIFSDEIATFLKDHDFKFCVSCDGPPRVQNLFRRTSAGEDSAAIVERTLLAAQQALPNLLVNAVYHPQTFRYLPETLDYLSGLGVRQIFLNPDYSARWTKLEAQELPAVYGALAHRYIAWYCAQDPHFVSLFDTKIAVLLRGGYHPQERCQMGTGELAITPDGGLYPCERLIGSGTDGEYRLGSIAAGLDLTRLACRRAAGGPNNPECSGCSLKDYCVNWCGCSNVFMTGYYNRVGPFLCASERAALQTSLNIFTTLERRLGPVFVHHLAGVPQWNSKPKD